MTMSTVGNNADDDFNDDNGEDKCEKVDENDDDDSHETGDNQQPTK